jgi:molecular chaperone DnaK
MTADLTPFVVGKLLGERAGIEAVQLRRSDGGWSSPVEQLAEDGTFTAMVMLLPRASSTFAIDGLRGGQRVALSPASFSIIHGLALGEPPLSRSVGVALADNSVRVYAERGSPLPLRRTFTHRTVEPVSPQLPGHALLIPVVQGEFPWAHLCRLVGVLELSSDKLSAALPADSAVEVTIELDRGGRLVASAHVPYTKQVFEEVARLAIPGSTPEEIEKSIVAAVQRAAEQHGNALASKDLEMLKRLSEVDRSLIEAEALADAARGGDADAAQRARRLVQEVVAILDELDSARAWPELVEDVESRRAASLSWISLHGTSQERATAERSSELLERALRARNTNEVMRQLGTLQRLANAAFFRQPGAWAEEFHCLAGMLDEAKDPKRANELLQRGRRALDGGDTRGLEAIVRQLWELMPVDRQSRQLGYQSGLV